MDQNRFFTVEIDESSGQAFRVMPSQYLEELHPHQAIAEMQEYIETLKDALEQYHQGPKAMLSGLGRIGSLAFELELVCTFLASFRQAYGTMH